MDYVDPRLSVESRSELYPSDVFTSHAIAAVSFTGLRIADFVNVLARAISPYHSLPLRLVIDSLIGN